MIRPVHESHVTETRDHPDLRIHKLGILRRCFLEFGQRLIQFPVVAQLLPLIDVILGCVEPQACRGELIGDIGGVLAQRLFGQGQCFIPLFAEFGRAALQ